MIIINFTYHLLDLVAEALHAGHVPVQLPLHGLFVCHSFGFPA